MNLRSHQPSWLGAPNEGGNDPSNFDRRSPEDQKAILLWIELAIQPAKTKCWTTSSYGLKHDCEDEIGFYINNGSFKGAMLRLGYEPVDREQRNWIFRIKPTRRSAYTNKKRFAGAYSSRVGWQGFTAFSISHLPAEKLVEFDRVIAAAYSAAGLSSALTPNHPEQDTRRKP